MKKCLVFVEGGKNKCSSCNPSYALVSGKCILEEGLIWSDQLVYNSNENEGNTDRART